jgi:hypothetical protein
VLILLSRCSVAKRGFVQNEIKHALKLAEEFPSSAIYIIPVRLEDCDPPVELKGLQWVDLFPDRQIGFEKLLKVLAPEGRDELLRRKIHVLTEEYQRLQREKGQETDTTALTQIETDITTVQAQRQQAETQLYDLHTAQEQPKKAITWHTAQDGKIISLRSEPLTVSTQEFKKVFGLTEDQRPLEYIQNEYEDQGEVIVDHATGPMWQKAGSDKRMLFRNTKAYIDDLNARKFAGFNDWRLPTIPELMSLLEPEKQSNDLYINAVFEISGRGLLDWYWSADLRQIKDESSPGSAWLVRFSSVNVGWGLLYRNGYGRAVRSRQ